MRKEFNEQYVQIVKKLIEDNAEFLKLHNYEIIFRHHPRYSVTQCPELKIENDFVSLLKILVAVSINDVGLNFPCSQI